MLSFHSQRELTDLFAYHTLLKEFATNSPNIAHLHSGVWNMSNAKKTAKSLEFPAKHRAVLVETLRRQYTSLGIQHETTHIQLEKLALPNSVTVCTGHQLGLFASPLFFLVKIAGVIANANALQEEGIHAVPVFWMASEDHDFDEIRGLHAWGKRWEIDANPSGKVGNFPAKKAYELWKVMQKERGFSSSLLAWNTLIEEAYKQETLAQATFVLVHALFGHHGLLVLEPDDIALKTLALPQFQEEIEHQASFHAFHAQPWDNRHKQQVNAREYNLFWLGKGSRERLVAEGEKIRIGNHIYSKTECIALLRAHPEQCSPNALLRPLYQQIILPNISYLGGGGEISYWLQLRSIFDHFKVPFPLLQLRHSFTILPTKTLQKLTSLPSTAQSMHLSPEKFLQEFSKETFVEPSILTNKKQTDKTFWETLATNDKKDAEFLGSMQRREEKIYDRMVTHYLRKHKRKQHEMQQRYEAVHHKIFPNNTFQERYLSPLEWAHIAPEHLIYSLITHSSSESQRWIVLEENSTHD